MIMIMREKNTVDENESMMKIETNKLMIEMEIGITGGITKQKNSQKQ